MLIFGVQLDAVALEFYFFLILLVVCADMWSTWSFMALARQLYREAWKKEMGLARYALKALGIRKWVLVAYAPLEFLAFLIVAVLFDWTAQGSGLPIGGFGAGLVLGFGVVTVRSNLIGRTNLRYRLEGKGDPGAPDLDVLSKQL